MFYLLDLAVARGVVTTCLSPCTRPGSAGSKSASGRDSVVTELDEQGREVGVTGPDPSRPKGNIWHQQTVDGAMSSEGTTAASRGKGEEGGEGGSLDRRSPGGPTAEELDPLRPAGPGGSKSVGAGGPGAYVAERLKEVAAGAWDTLKHGVNNPGQPQVMEELKRTSPQDFEALTNPRGAATARQKQQQQQREDGSEKDGSSRGGEP
ncbi:hypothetical protein VOLCADRAFT_94298 [Volvox carteri f. nagariensis]|uniref:Uncharacterized protein n=1 Tax=Volvox carteri f. nagariensis TaxID=3068 RepID=D8U449_VOLCA|nr:uncharacterized protein VOLCADRAFT_94298 [Volvox carteri f. nagariensis]EFJ45436.1 hypothetical protein VOLCADRAFT_94298 [Volvox carteri f. nagariensis]|eukprot:XP_002953463.1 hypothetical protein VOLCADRAFT_94298 [Volvox carteri f. nagariensis]